MKHILLICISFLALLASSAAGATRKTLPRPTAAQLAWHDKELTMFIHFGPATFQDHEYDDLSTPLSAINPTALDTEQWADVAASYGAKIVIFCAKHTGGFAWWQTSTTNYGIKETPWRGGRGDLLKELSESLSKRNIQLGIYLSPEDRYLGVGMGGKAADTTFQKQYEQIYRTQLTELLTRYGEIGEVWIDGSLIFDISDIVKRYAPHAAILQSPAATIRWVGNESGFAAYPSWNGIRNADARSGNSTGSSSDPNGDTWLPIEVDVSIRRPNWFWKSWNEKDILPLDELMKIYYCSVGRGTTLLINACPDTTGRIAPAEAARFKEFGQEIARRFSSPVAQSRTFRMTVDSTIDHLVLREDIAHGERIRKFTIFGSTDRQWDTLFNGSAIGHKLIVQIPQKHYDQVKIQVNESVGKPRLRDISAYNTGAPYMELPVVKQGWHLRNVGSWNIRGNAASQLRLQLDLTEYCTTAESYEIAFVVYGGGYKNAQHSYDWQNTGRWEDNIPDSERLTVGATSLRFAGVEANHYLQTPDVRNRIAFNLTGIPSQLLVNTTIQVPAGLDGAVIEAYLLKK